MPTNASGVPMPTTDLPGWDFKYGQEFGGTALPSDWGAYEGQPGGAPNAWWDPSHVTVHDGVLELSTYKDPAANSASNVWTSGGTMLLGQAQTYGKYLVNFRAEKGDGVAAIGLLWPEDNSWPPEIDFFEDGGGDRSGTTATLHYDSDNKMIWRETTGDFTQWHTLGVEWTPGKVRYTMDGQVWGEVQHSGVPSVPMDLAVQTQMWDPTSSTPSRVDMEVDWVAVYAYDPNNPGEGGGTPVDKAVDTITVRVSEDYYNGHAQFKVWGDQTLIGNGTVTASHAQGQWQDITFTLDLPADTERVFVEFTNDAWGGTETADRNMYLDSITVNGYTMEPDNDDLTGWMEAGGVNITDPAILWD